MEPGIHRIALIGPESTGKSTLCERLSARFHTIHVPEFAREYLSSLNRPYGMEDVLYCAKMQLQLEKELLPAARDFLFADTELINIRIWLLDKYGECPQWIEDKISETKYDLYLLTVPDIPFVDDPLRENPDRREYFFNLYKEELERRKFGYATISGSYENRFQLAVDAVNVIASTP